MFQSISLSAKSSPQALVVGQFSLGSGKDAKGAPLDGRTRSLLAGHGLLDAVLAALSRPEATGEAGSVVEAFPAASPAPRKAARAKPAPQIARIYVVGLGDKAKFEAGSLRNAAAAVGRRIAALKLAALTLAVELDGPIADADLDAHTCGSAFGEGLGLLGWVCDQFRGKATPQPVRTRLTLRSGEAEFAGGLERGLGLAESANLCRTLSQTPPNIATPEYMADQARKLARKHGLSCRVMEPDELKKEGMIGHLSVGMASENQPRMIRLEYAPKGGAKGKPIVLIGKTICYDTGGLSLKVNNGMVGMKRDKDGGCAVLGAMHAIATVIKPRKRVVAFLAAAENSISDEAYRPDDVIKYRNGVTVEVTNTDAEGRLVLADALCWACEKENPAFIVDLATLTGGVIVALGSTFCGMFCEDDKLRARIEAAASATGERVWRLPMHAEYRDMMKSPVADIVNSNPNRKAHPIQGAAFLSYFVDDKVPWCHLDIAGVHVAEKNAGMFIDGPTGWGVRLLASLVENA